MNTSDRISQLMTMIETREAMTIAELAIHFGVSEETIRRDVRQLESQGRVVKVHGGVRRQELLVEPPYRRRINLNAGAKRQVAKTAAALVDDGMSIFIDSGSTSYWFSRALVQPKNLLVITNSLEVAGEVAGRNDWRLVFTGGQIDGDYRAAFGQEAMAQARRFTPDLLFLSIGGINPEIGLLDFHVDEVDFKRSLLDRAREKVVLADASKFACAGAVHLANFDEVDVLVCDQAPDAKLDRRLTDAGVEVKYLAD